MTHVSADHVWTIEKVVGLLNVEAQMIFLKALAVGVVSGLILAVICVLAALWLPVVRHYQTAGPVRLISWLIAQQDHQC